jgi:hypothetical protein
MTRVGSCRMSRMGFLTRPVRLDGLGNPSYLTRKKSLTPTGGCRSFEACVEASEP